MTIGAPSYYPAGPIDIRDGTIARVKAMTGFANVFGNRVLPTKDSQMPFACVWHAGDRTEPNGDANTGVPSFDHTLLMAVSIVVRGRRAKLRSIRRSSTSSSDCVRHC